MSAVNSLWGNPIGPSASVIAYATQCPLITVSSEIGDPPIRNSGSPSSKEFADPGPQYHVNLGTRLSTFSFEDRDPHMRMGTPMYM